MKDLGGGMEESHRLFELLPGSHTKRARSAVVYITDSFRENRPIRDLLKYRANTKLKVVFNP